MPDLQKILDACWRYPFPLEFDVPEGYVISEEEQAMMDNAEPSLVGWGFTVYRTYYGPGSDENWDTLCNKAKEEADKELMACIYDGNEEIAEKLKPLFRLDARSDPVLLDGLSLAELCKVYKDKTGGEPEPVHRCCVFLVADEQVLSQIGQGNFIIKAVDADSPPSPQEGASVTSRSNGFSWGWHVMEIRQMLEFWGMLDICLPHQCMCWAVDESELYNMVWEGCDGS
ncbi:hypothetical protein FAVG1_10951 [Fusarium avenaceum]|nr:hypothetical protein FAVG1_10951 [Fusarium avenaceum]